MEKGKLHVVGGDGHLRLVIDGGRYDCRSCLSGDQIRLPYFR